MARSTAIHGPCQRAKSFGINDLPFWWVGPTDTIWHRPTELAR